MCSRFAPGTGHGFPSMSICLHARFSLGAGTEHSGWAGPGGAQGTGGPGCRPRCGPTRPPDAWSLGMRWRQEEGSFGGGELWSPVGSEWRG